MTLSIWRGKLENDDVKILRMSWESSWTKKINHEAEAGGIIYFLQRRIDSAIVDLTPP